jgi:hypothetical protein
LYFYEECVPVGYNTLVWKSPYISEEHIASIFIVEEEAKQEMVKKQVATRIETE